VERERENENVCVSKRGRERENENVCVSMRERERENENVCEYERERFWSFWIELFFSFLQKSKKLKIFFNRNLPLTFQPFLFIVIFGMACLYL